jgi:hypothetical protein
VTAAADPAPVAEPAAAPPPVAPEPKGAAAVPVAAAEPLTPGPAAPAAVLKAPPPPAPGAGPEPQAVAAAPPAAVPGPAEPAAAGAAPLPAATAAPLPAAAVPVARADGAESLPQVARDAPPGSADLPPPPPLTAEELAIVEGTAPVPEPIPVPATEAPAPAGPAPATAAESPAPLLPAPEVAEAPQEGGVNISQTSEAPTLLPDPALPPAPKVETARLPRIETLPPAEPSPGAAPEPAPAAVAEATPAPPAPSMPGTRPAPITDNAAAPETAAGGPLTAFARAFDNPQGKPRFAVVLIDTGEPDLDRMALAALPFPVTFALDPTAPGADLAATIYREAGQEVAMLATGIPQGATAADLEVTFGVHAGVLPEAVAVLDPETDGFQGNRALATLAVPVIAGQGRGMLSWDRGLNAADQVARREGVPSATIFRRLDAEDEPELTIRRYLDRAAFKAAQDGAVVVAGTTRPETVAALLSWAVEGRAATVALAPLTAVLAAP